MQALYIVCSELYRMLSEVKCEVCAAIKAERGLPRSCLWSKRIFTFCRRSERREASRDGLLEIVLDGAGLVPDLQLPNARQS